MFDDGSIETDGNVAVEAVREADWKELHRRLRSIAKRRVALEAEKAGYLVEAEESRLYRRLGYTSMLEYMERELHYGPHAANERLRVAHALIDLPLIGELFGCHKRHHEGRLRITGQAPDGLQFTWKHDDDVDSATSGPSWDWVPVDADGTQETGSAPDRRPDDRASRAEPDDRNHAHDLHR